MRNFKPAKKRGYKKRMPRKAKAQVTAMKKVAKSVIAKALETKTINCIGSNFVGGSAGTYFAQSGLFYLAQDVFKCPQGVLNTTALGGQNRIGDKTRAIGFKLSYDFLIPSNYSVGTSVITLGFVKLRVVVWTQRFGVPIITYPLLFDANFMALGTYTQQPINWGEGFVKSVLMDESYIIRPGTRTINPASQLPWSNVFQLRKYIPYDKIIKYADNNSSNPDGTDIPIYVAFTAEYDTPSTVTPSTVMLTNVQGFTQAWYKDG